MNTTLQLVKQRTKSKEQEDLSEEVQTKDNPVEKLRELRKHIKKCQEEERELTLYLKELAASSGKKDAKGSFSIRIGKWRFISRRNEPATFIDEELLKRYCEKHEITFPGRKVIEFDEEKFHSMTWPKKLLERVIQCGNPTYAGFIEEVKD